MLTAAFYFLAFTTILFAILVVASKNPVHSVLYLVLTFFGISANYIFLLDAPFIGLVNIIVYAGAIMVLFLFVIMLMNLGSNQEPRTPLLFKVAGTLAAGALLIILASAVKQAGMQEVTGSLYPDGPVGSMKVLGNVLFTDYILPFEVASILFLVAIIGAVVLGRKENEALTAGHEPFNPVNSR